MEKMDAMGIKTFHENLPFGQKGKLETQISLAIGQCPSNVRRKIRLGIWNEKTELPLVNNVLKNW